MYKLAAQNNDEIAINEQNNAAEKNTKKWRLKENLKRYIDENDEIKNKCVK